MDPVLRAALAPVLRDIERTGAPMPTVADGRNDEPELPYRYADLSRMPGGGSSASIDTSEPEATCIVSATDDVQDWLIHYLWNQVQLPTNCRCAHGIRATIRSRRSSAATPPSGSARATRS